MRTRTRTRLDDGTDANAGGAHRATATTAATEAISKKGLVHDVRHRAVKEGFGTRGDARERERDDRDREIDDGLTETCACSFVRSFAQYGWWCRQGGAG